MADDPTPTPDPDPPTDPEPAKDTLGDAGKKALEEERKARRDAEKALRDVQAKLKELEDKDKSEVDRLREENASLKQAATEYEARALRAEVAMEKGLTAAQAKRLHGNTLEELQADADEILEAFPAKTGATPPPSKTPTPTLRGGVDPTEETVDVKSLVDSIPPTA